METNVFELQYRLCLLKSYYDKGYNLTKPLLILVGLFGLSSNNVQNTIILGVLYLVFALIVGWLWFKTNFIRAEAEVTNRHNYFQQEIRKLFGIPNNHKIYKGKKSK